jgi:thiosulfate dehydrogenase [quinone] large subunit
MNSTKMFCGKIFDFFTTDKRSAILWVFVRVYVGYEWLIAGWHKLGVPVWTGDQAGVAVSGFLNGSLAKMAGEHPDVSVWYGWLINHVFLPNATALSYIVTYGEIIIGITLIIGLWTRLSAFFGIFMNFNYLFAGTVSSNPWLLLLQLLIIGSHKTAGWIGVDRYIKK